MEQFQHQQHNHGGDRCPAVHDDGGGAGSHPYYACSLTQIDFTGFSRRGESDMIQCRSIVLIVPDYTNPVFTSNLRQATPFFDRI